MKILDSINLIVFIVFLVGAIVVSSCSDKEGDPSKTETDGTLTTVNPINPDSDNDGYPDWIEDKYGSDPNDPNSIPANADVDTDGDGFTDIEEEMFSTDPEDEYSFPDADSNIFNSFGLPSNDPNDYPDIFVDEEYDNPNLPNVDGYDWAQYSVADFDLKGLLVDNVKAMGLPENMDMCVVPDPYKTYLYNNIEYSGFESAEMQGDVYCTGNCLTSQSGQCQNQDNSASVTLYFKFNGDEYEFYDECGRNINGKFRIAKGFIIFDYEVGCVNIYRFIYRRKCMKNGSYDQMNEGEAGYIREIWIYGIDKIEENELRLTNTTGMAYEQWSFQRLDIEDCTI